MITDADFFVDALFNSLGCPVAYYYSYYYLIYSCFLKEACQNVSMVGGTFYFFNIFFGVGVGVLVCWPLLCLCRPFCIIERCLDSNPESCCSKQARY
jgi:hypothetical protein